MKDFVHLAWIKIKSILQIFHCRDMHQASDKKKVQIQNVKVISGSDL